MTRTIEEQLGANNTENTANKVNIAQPLNKKLKCKINICRSSLTWWQRQKKDNESI